MINKLSYRLYGEKGITMKEVFLTPEPLKHLYMHSYVFAGGYLYNRTEFYTFVRVEIRVKSGEHDD